MTRQNGFTIVELMIYLAMLAVFCAITCGTVISLYRSESMANSYVDDLAACQKALAVLESDTRQARDVAMKDGKIHVLGIDHGVTYHVIQGQLRRTSAGATTVVARCIQALHVERKGRLVTLRLVLLPRSENARVEASVSTTIYLRNAGDDR